MAYGLKWLWSWRASVIALLAVFFDGVLHYTLPSSIAVPEWWVYFVVKYVVVEISAALLLAMKFPSKLRSWTPFLIGFVGSSAFGAIYYVYPWISSEPGYLTLPYRLLWGVFHALVIWMAAAIVLRKPSQVYLVLALLFVSVAAGILASVAFY